MSKLISYLIGSLMGVIILLASSLWVFLAPLFQADEMLAQIHVENVINDNCYFVSLVILPESDTQQSEDVLTHQTICGDFLGLGYEFTLPEKSFALMQKPGIVVTNLVAIEKKTRNQTGNIQVGRYEIEIMESLRELVADLLKRTPMIKSITYDMKFLLQRPQEGAVITYKLEPFRQQVFIECDGCEE